MAGEADITENLNKKANSKEIAIIPPRATLKALRERTKTWPS